MPIDDEDEEELEGEYHCKICGGPLVTPEEIKAGVHFDCSSALYTDKMKELTGMDLF
jgi:hypothetical protein